VKYALDTNIYIDALRDSAVEAALLAFLERALPFTFLSAVVMQELAAGARTPAQVRELERPIFQPFVRRSRLFAPMTTAFVRGRMIAALAAKEGWAAIHDNASLVNDALLAASCREAGITLLTNDSDFDRFAPFMKGWRPVRPWPEVG
jgi:predicted nucleic acid-binding protein